MKLQLTYIISIASSLVGETEKFFAKWYIFIDVCMKLQKHILSTIKTTNYKGLNMHVIETYVE